MQRQFHTYEEVEHAVYEKVRERIMEGRFLTTLLKGEFSEGQIRDFALQYSYYLNSRPSYTYTGSFTAKAL